jgi:DNA-binding transcriptional ArsR family regulator
MRGRRGLHRPGVLELDVPVAEVLEHPRHAAEQHRDQVDRQLVDQPGPQVLPTGFGAAHHRHVLLPGGGSGELAQRMGVSAGSVSEHLTTLRRAGLATRRRQGRRVIDARTARGGDLRAAR